MKISTLIENTSESSNLICEHGLSLYIETERHNILFDAGQTDAFADNAQALGINLREVDLAILSHGHYDHSGGLMRFLQINQTAPVYLSRQAFSACFHGQDRYIGIDPAIAKSHRLVFNDNELCICPGLTLHSCNDKPLLHEIDSAGLTILKDGSYHEDHFEHEQYLLIEENSKRYLISGCSHKGILNIVHWFQPDVLIGGFHFMNLDPKTDAAILRNSAETLLQYPTTYYTGHCTGSAPYDFMKNIMGTRLHQLSTGKSIEL